MDFLNVSPIVSFSPLMSNYQVKLPNYMLRQNLFRPILLTSSRFILGWILLDNRERKNAIDNGS
jgi:hypothetical protein